MTTTERQYDYRPKWSTILLGGIFFGVAAVALFVMAGRSDRGIIVSRVVKLSPEIATIVLWILGLLSLCFVALAGVLAFTRLKFRQRIVVTDTGLILPRSRWSAEEMAVPFGDIVSCTTESVGRQRFLKINYGTGTFTLTESMLPKKADFHEIRNAIGVGTGL